MLRFRRYRIFLVLAVFTVFFLYRFTNIRDWDSSSKISVDGLRNLGQNGAGTVPPTSIAKAAAPKASPTVDTIETPSSVPAPTVPDEAPVAKGPDVSPAPESIASPTKQTPTAELPAAPVVAYVPPPRVEEEEFGQTGQGRLEVEPVENAPPRAHWTKQEPHFPLPIESLISLPTGKPKDIPKIQHVFAEETADKKMDRERRLASIREAFQTTWSSYRQYAWMNDELSPVSGGSRNPFCGWAATLVDSLDTLWIMGMKDDFEIAANAVQSIDFTVSLRKDIPLFETVIRYLGGLIAAYDLSEGQHKGLLEKAVELAEVLMGVFDTPNRMPQTFYNWAPAYASQPHRAGARVVLAELGSLSLEFTRLAQITKEMKYYDAVARITDELEKWQQHTKLPGMWPTSVDASGCKKPEVNMAQIEHSRLNGPQDPLPQIPAQALPDRQPFEESASSPQQGDSPQAPKSQAAAENAPEKQITPDEGFSKGKIQNWEKASSQPGAGRAGATKGRNASPAVSYPVRKRQLDDSALSTGAGAVQEEPKLPTNGESSNVETKQFTNAENGNSEKAECEPQGLSSPPYAKLETFTLGGQSDSTYEYLPKEYMLLGGLQEQYRSMYEKSMATVRKYLLFRPMTQNRRNILVAGKVKTRGHPDASGDVPSDLEMVYESTHLTCFAGGMFAIGAKIFGIEGDMDIASKLTDGCVWAYENTQTGIMPEGLELIACENSKSCEWNETLWWDRLDPMRKYREQQWQEQETSRQQLESALLPKATTVPEVAPGETTIYSDDPNRISTEKENTPSTDGNTSSGAGGVPLVKRQEASTEGDTKKLVDSNETAREQASKTSPEELRSDEEPATNYIAGMPLQENKYPKPMFTPPRMPTHEEYVKTRIAEERIPPGFTELTSRKYILRPEAIESVFIMYRITGDDYWREKGWKMFTAIQSYTRTPLGNSAILDVTSEVPSFSDEMESFWLAETLKYFYLLFSEPGLISLDDYVFNTEAHPFKRP